ncbi:hypothetical protein [Lactobacillus gallinarum]|uniref:hypothetical protein n=1 Tax=Lactobacillus gallinarum TaxID=52242 RepID=UPI00195D0C95|nr:hypothetical protein [Lactobacillus gallinarum]MBM6973848.1 hypothetical protein [Lactobacillus gallinarum]
MEKQHFYQDSIILDEYPKAFKILSEPTQEGIKLSISYKSNAKPFGLIKLENTELTRSSKAYFLYLGKGYTDEGFAFMHEPSAFEEQSFLESLGQQEIKHDKQQIKMFLVDSTNFVMIGRAIMDAVFGRLTGDEFCFEEIHDDWKK